MEEIKHTLKISKRARSISLRPDFENNQVIITLPSKRFEKKGLEFFEQKKQWIQKHFTKHQKSKKNKINIIPDTTITICGEKYLLKRHSERGVFAQDGVLFVSGSEAVFESRVRRFAKKIFEKYAKKEIKILSKKLGKTVKEIQIKSMKSRWGSCGTNKKIALAEQLSLAPKHIMDYVISHEVAHLEEMNHSKAFWDLLEKLYYGDVSTAKAWLKIHGKTI